MISLFWLLSPAKRAELQQWYWDVFGMNLEIPPDPYKQPSVVDTPNYDEEQEIATAKFMSRKPKHPRKVQ